MITLGLDLSLVKTGFAVLKDGKLINSGLIKSKPSGDTPLHELVRLMGIVGKIEEVIDKTGLGYGNPDLVIVENLAFMARNSTALTQLAGLSYLVREMLFGKSIFFAMVAPTTLKKFVTGKGNADKNLVMMEIYKQYGHSALDDNEADAYALAALGAAVLGKPINKLTRPQSEVVELIKKQL